MTAMFGALASIPLIVPLVARHRYVLFVLPCIVLAVAAVRCRRTAAARPRDRAVWHTLSVGTALCALAAALAAASPLGSALVDAGLYAGSSGSIALLVAALLLARRWTVGARLERLVNALLFDAVVIAVAVFFVVAPGFERGDVVLTAVFVIDVVALAVGSVAANAAADARDRAVGWCFVGTCAAASVGDGFVALGSFGSGGSPTLTAIMWALGGLLLILAASDPAAHAEPAAEAEPSRWIGLRVVLPLLAVVFFPALTLGLSLGGKLSTGAIIYFASFFVATLILTFGRQAYLLAEHRRAAVRERGLRAEVVRRNEELEALTTLAATMTERLEEDPIVERGLDALRLGARATSVALHIRDDESLSLRAVVGDWAREAPWTSRDVPSQWRPGTEVRGERLIIRLAVAARGRELGLVTAIRPAHDRLSQEEAGLLQLLVGQLAVAIQNAREYQERLEQAIRDPLTGVYNRRYFFETLDQEHHRSSRSRAAMSLVVIDVDDFKRVNDTLGHAAGDEVLRELALVGSELVRPGDTFARLGGEEFALLLPSTSQLEALLVAERLRRAVAECDVLRDHRVTVSAGVATWPDDAGELDALQAKADAALYWAKRNGKNICAAASEVVVSAGGEDDDSGLRHLHALAALIDSGLAFGRNHSHDVASYATAIGERLGLAGERLGRLRRAALFHDVGFAAVPAEMLTKPCPLVPAELEEVRRHAQIGASMLLHCGFTLEAEWVRDHHEHFDGNGYPHRRSRGEVALEARIIAVADAFEAMTSPRPYRPALEPEAALAEARRCAGTQFDARVVEALAAIVAGGSHPLVAAG